MDSWLDQIAEFRLREAERLKNERRRENREAHLKVLDTQIGKRSRKIQREKTHLKEPK